MLTFANKYFVPFTPETFAEVTAITLGATILDDSTFEVCADDDSTFERSAWVPFSHFLRFRLTAKTQEERWAWLLRFGHHLGDSLESAVLNQRGYWQPTDEYEPSWLLKTNLVAPTPDLLSLIYEWLTACDQQAVYMEFDGAVYILNREEVLTFLVPA